MDAIHLPPAITLPTAFGAPGQALQPGQVVQALVLELIESDIFRLQLPQAIVDVRSDVALTPGSTITLAVKGAGANTRFVIYADDAGPAPAARTAPPTNAASSASAAPPASAAPSGLSGKHPIGEAVIVARAPAPAGRAGEPAVARDAPLGPAAPRAPIARPPDVPAQAPAQAPAQVPATPERALGEAVRAAASRQSGLAPLFADAEQVVKASDVPAPVRAAAQQVMALRVPLDTRLTAGDVKQAFAQSGVLFEPRLAGHRATVSSPAPSAPAATPRAPATSAPAASGSATSRLATSDMPAPSGDLKAALLVFRHVLRSWADETAPLRAASPLAPSVVPSAPDHAKAARPLALSDSASIRHLANALAGVPDELPPAAPPLSPEQATNLARSVATALTARDVPDHAPGANGPPPYRGAPLAAQQPVPASIGPDLPAHETAERLLGATEGALARTTLLQAASLPDQNAGVQRLDSAAQRWTFEVPFITPQGTGAAQFEVSRDGQAAKSDRPVAVWRARFSLDVEPMGLVHALIALVGERASVTLWAERHATAARLNENAALLNEALRAAELEPADVQFRVGAPPAARQPAPGRFMDRAT